MGAASSRDHLTSRLVAAPTTNTTCSFQITGKNYKEITEKNLKLLELEKIKDGLIHMIVHDLRNPLGSIFGNLDLMLIEKEKLSQDQAKRLETCIGNCQELKEMIDSLIDIYKMEEGQIKLNIEMTDLNELIGDCIQQFSVTAKENQISLSFGSLHSNLSIQVDRGLVKRVIANLINNSIRHTPPGGEIKITAELYQRDGKVHVEVIDNGDGIEPEYHNKVFEKFEQINLQKSGVSIGTSGLGLSFCKLAIEAHGGKIWVDSEGEDKGSNFQLILPVTQSMECELYERLQEPVYEGVPSIETVTPCRTLSEIGLSNQP